MNRDAFAPDQWVYEHQEDIHRRSPLQPDLPPSEVLKLQVQGLRESDPLLLEPLGLPFVLEPIPDRKGEAQQDLADHAVEARDDLVTVLAVEAEPVFGLGMVLP